MAEIDRRENPEFLRKQMTSVRLDGPYHLWSGDVGALLVPLVPIQGMQRLGEVRFHGGLPTQSRAVTYPEPREVHLFVGSLNRCDVQITPDGFTANIPGTVVHKEPTLTPTGILLPTTPFEEPGEEIPYERLNDGIGEVLAAHAIRQQMDDSNWHFVD